MEKRRESGMTGNLPDIRCGACGRKLGEGIYLSLKIKCQRCKTLNFLRAESAELAHRECLSTRDTREKLPQ